MVLLIINILTLQMLGFINSQWGIWGILLYIPALFLLPSSIYLNGNHAIIVLTLTGFCIDYHFNVPLGFHSFALVFVICSQEIGYTQDNRLKSTARI